MQSTEYTQVTSWFERLMMLACLLSFWGMASSTAWQKSPTADEPIHLTRGIVISQGQDYRLQQEHAPLSHWLMSLLIRDEPLPDVTMLEGWDTAERLLVARAVFEDPATNIDRLVWLGRLPIVFSGLLLGAMMMRWAAAVGGREARLAAGVLFAFSPNLIANASLATTDFVTTVTYVACLFTLWRYWQRPTWGRWLLAGLCLGLGLSSKMTG
ncbi:MAG: glycosyltransferase family 39 protein, partial [Anaerolineales bacterium]|nr:glycosyltransferase family 39 protein [Anaerolineales bacterium]